MSAGALINWLEAYPDISAESRYLARGSVETAPEVAEQLGTSTASVISALQRVRKAIASTAPTQQTVLRKPG